MRMLLELKDWGGEGMKRSGWPGGNLYVVKLELISTFSVSASERVLVSGQGWGEEMK